MAQDQTRYVNAAGLAAVLMAHAVLLGWLWSQRLIPAPPEALTLFVDFITPPAHEVDETPRLPPAKPHKIEKSQAHQLVAEAPITSPSEYVAPPIPSAPVTEVPPAPVPKPAGLVSLGAELSVVCMERSSPAYPPISRRLGEEGTVTLRVELDEQGLVTARHIAASSGYPRLDEAALAAIRDWRCTPAQRNGKPARAVALQPFKFILQGN